MTRTGRLWRAATTVITRPSLLKSRRYVFLLSHMRGYTTLVSHILGSHPDISGYAENRLSYRTQLDLLKLRCLSYHLGNYKSNCRYFLDKLLHNEFFVADSILKRENVHVIFMIREPAATLKSIVAMYHKRIEEGATPSRLVPGTVEEALRHYSDRLDKLSSVGEHLQRSGKHALVIRADEVIENPGSVLNELGAFLHLRTPLDEQYSVFDRTGTRFFGDPSEFIRKGRIERERPIHGIAVPDLVLEQAHRAYERCLLGLRKLFDCSAPS